MEPSRNIRRQPAWHVFASEFGEATLNEKGSGEYDPSFVITRLGAKINRCLVAGLLKSFMFLVRFCEKYWLCRMTPR